MKIALTMLLLIGSLFAQTPPKAPGPITPPPKVEIPKIPDSYQIKLQALANQQKDLQIKLRDTIDQYRAIQDQLNKTNLQGKNVEDQMFIELKLVPQKYNVQTDKDGVLVIVEINPPVDPAEKK